MNAGCFTAHPLYATNQAICEQEKCVFCEKIRGVGYCVMGKNGGFLLKIGVLVAGGAKNVTKSDGSI